MHGRYRRARLDGVHARATDPFQVGFPVPAEGAQITFDDCSERSRGSEFGSFNTPMCGAKRLLRGYQFWLGCQDGRASIFVN
jgi:hypothetical protein